MVLYLKNLSGQADYSMDHRIEILKLIVSVGVVLDLTRDIISQKLLSRQVGYFLVYL